MRMAAPSVLRRFARIIIWIIIDRHVDICRRRNIAVIFLFQGVAVIFKMIENVQRATSGILHQTGANFGATQKRGQAGMVIPNRRQRLRAHAIASTQTPLEAHPNRSPAQRADAQLARR